MSCPDCFRGAVHTHAEPTGKIETLHGVTTYVAGGSDPDRSKSTIIYLPDVFSLKLVNNKILADKYASVTGSRVLVPDVVRNGGMPVSVLHSLEYILEGGLTVYNALPKAWNILTVLPTAIPHMIWGHPKNSYPKILAYARDVRAELPAGGKLGAAGCKSSPKPVAVYRRFLLSSFTPPVHVWEANNRAVCWGAWPSTKLCAEVSKEGGSERLIDAQFNGHPSYIIKEPTVVADSIRAFKTPYSSAVAEKDFQFNADVAAKTEAQLRESVGSKGDGENGYVYEFRVYKGATHGFCVKAREEDMQNYHDAAKQATEWFNKYLN